MAVELGSPVVSVSINARRLDVAAVGLETGPPVLVTFADRTVRQLPTLDLGARPLSVTHHVMLASGRG